MCSIVLAGLNNLRITNRIATLTRQTFIPYKTCFANYSENKQAEHQESSERPAENNDATATNANANGESGDDTLRKLREENAQLLERVKEMDDKFKRALAEGENTRVRMRKQIEEAKVFGIQAFCKDLLEVADVLDKALGSVPEDQLESNSSLKELFTGVKMTNDQLQTIFRRHGLVKINPIGEKFNPNDHHAMFEAVIPGKEPGTVSVVTQIGYKLKDRTIRPAMVGVVKAQE